jgi:hypothetical protein
VARSDNGMNSRILSDRRRRNSEWVDDILNFDSPLWLTMRDPYLALFPWAMLNFFEADISIQVELRYHCRISISAVFFDIPMLFPEQRLYRYNPLISESNSEFRDKSFISTKL